jgi:putative ABC transport system ATP-binding protein
MERNLFTYSWRRTRLQQIWILLVILLSMPPSFALLDLPKLIVNGPIQGRGFEHGATERFFAFSIPVPSVISSNNQLQLTRGFEFNRTTALFVLSGLFLFLVIVNGVFKYYINTYKGRLGEQMLQVLRFELFDRILRFPSTDLSRVKPAEVATMIKDEVEPLGGFIGDAFVQPFFLGGQIVTSMTFILVQSFWLGLVTIFLLLVQGVVIPRLRRRLLVLSRQRQISARALAGRIGEVIEDMPSIRSNDIANFQRAEIIQRLTHVFFIRFALYQWKFLVKFLNNLLAQLTPFFYYAIGGYFATIGVLDIGQLVAVISAYKDLPSPVKELIDWDQQRLDVEVKYHQVIDQFSAEGALLPPAKADADGPLPRLTGELALQDLSVTDASQAKILDNLNVQIGLFESVAIVNADHGGAEVLADTLAGLVVPESGRITIDNRDFREWPHAVVRRRISYSGPEPFFPQSTLADALLAGVRFAPRALTDATESKKSPIIAVDGVDLDFDADWVDYEVVAADGPAQLHERMKTAAWVVNFDDDIVNWGLNRTLDQDGITKELEDRIVKARGVLRKRLAEGNLTHLVEPFDPNRYCQQATIAENLLFGAARGNAAERDRLVESPPLLKVLSRQRLDADLFGIGRDIAATLIEVFSGITTDNRLFAQQALMSPDEFADYNRALKRLGPNTTYARAGRADRSRFLRLALSYIEPRDRLGLLTEELETGIVEARHAFHDELGELQSMIAFYDPATYNDAASLQDNILLGRVAFGVASASKRVSDFVRAIVDDLGLRDIAFRAGLSFDVGPAGKRLSRGQRQQLSLARALLRRPDLLIAHRALAALDGQSQLLVLDRILSHARGAGDHRFGVIWALENPRFAEMFDRVLVLEHGKLVENGRPDEFRGENSYFGRLRA